MTGYVVVEGGIVSDLSDGIKVFDLDSLLDIGTSLDDLEDAREFAVECGAGQVVKRLDKVIADRYDEQRDLQL